MRFLLAMLACAMAAGCDYVAPLAGVPELDMDPQVVGAWERQADNARGERLLVLPLSKREYLVAFSTSATNTLYAKAWRCRAGGKMLVQLQWIGTAEGKVPEDSRLYQCAAYEVSGDQLQVRMLSTAIVSRDLTSSAAMARAIDANKDNPALFIDPMSYRKAAR